jgi:hypothetical protein
MLDFQAHSLVNELLKTDSSPDTALQREFTRGKLYTLVWLREQLLDDMTDGETTDDLPY